MKKRILSGLLCATLLTSSLSIPAFAATTSVDEAAYVLAALDIMTGNENGDLMLDRTITRAEFTKLIIAASPLRDTVGTQTATAPYPDVQPSHWAAGYIQAAVDAGFVRGNLAGYFEPSRDISLAECATMALRLLGYSDDSFSGAYPAGQMAKFNALGLDENLKTTDANTPITREDAVHLFYNLMLTKTASGSAYQLNMIKPNEMLMTSSGDIDLVALVNSAMEGPVVASGSWTTSIPFDLDTATIYRSGVETTVDSIQAHDVVYYSKPMRTLWVYSNRVSGTIQDISPTSAPTSVTMAGKTYGLETTAVAFALSDLGPYRVGDLATLLLGRNGQVCAVLDSTETSSVVQGMVTDVSTGSYADANGNTYNATTLYLTATDGETYSYRYDDGKFEEGDYLQASITDGSVAFSKLSTLSLSGKVNASGTALDNYTFADDIQILDTYGNDKTIRIYPNRLAGMSITEKMVVWHQLDGNGHISRLILKDATGDMHSYGVVTDVTEVSYYMSQNGTYLLDFSGIPAVVSGTKLYNLKELPVQVKYNDGDVDSMTHLTAVSLEEIDENTALSGNQSYAISDSVAVYEYRDKEYFLSSLATIDTANTTLTGYYDKAQSDGGRIRVIVAK